MNKIRLKILGIILLAATSYCAKGQTFGIYSLSMNKKQDCYINFFNSGRYYIEIIEYVTDDMVESMILSYGTYLIKNDEITLMDNFYNYKMKLLKIADSLVVKQSFRCFLNKKFAFYEKNNGIEPEFLKKNNDSIKLSQERVEYINANKIPYQLDFGIYEKEMDYVLYLEKDNTYKLAYRWSMLSEGTWNRDGNIVKLYDTSLMSCFYLKIDKTGLISNYLPGNDKAFLLKRRK